MGISELHWLAIESNWSGSIKNQHRANAFEYAIHRMQTSGKGIMTHSHTHTLTHSDTHTHGVEWWSNQGGEISVGCPVFVLGRPGPHLVTQPPPFTLLFHPPPSLSIGAITQRSSSSAAAVAVALLLLLGFFHMCFYFFLASLPPSVASLLAPPLPFLFASSIRTSNSTLPSYLPFFLFFFYFIYLCILFFIPPLPPVRPSPPPST